MQQIDHTKNIIEVNNLSFSYNGHEVLKDINFSIHKGDYLGIIGPNGGGKTTLLKLILKLLTPSGGNIKLFGKDIDQFRDWSKISYIPQKVTSSASDFPATVKEVVAMGRYAKRGLLHWPNKYDQQIVAKALEHVEMLEYANRQIADLSGGQQQRVFIARALAEEPEVIFLDEPTVGVDLKTQEQFYALLKKLNKDLNLTLILVTHDIDVVTSEATELACINLKLVYHGTPKEFIKEEYLSKLYGKEVKFILHGH